ncbi:hypothetical protein ABZW30_39615 [Kitasatospora sp. NPDC004669]|uniref:hypothetical protein n=1 Tax=Kitasatospora sp. NPDC004669 TaxID=3154555 RepID=UPI0033BAD3E9
MPGPALTAAAENPRGETPPPADGPAAELLELGEALPEHDARFLLQLERAEHKGDSALARRALADLLRAADGLAVRHRELAERMLDAHPTQTAGPDPAAPEPLVSPRGETAALFGGSPATAGPVSAAASVPAPAAGGTALEGRPAPVAPWGETPPGGERLRDLVDQAPRPAADRTPARIRSFRPGYAAAAAHRGPGPGRPDAPPPAPERRARCSRCGAVR